MFSPTTIEVIGSYVYALTDSEHRIFYVGKGQGNRVYQHVEEVRQLIKDDPDGRLAQPDADDASDSGIGPKRQKIAELLRAGKQPGMYIIREGLTADQALLVEASLISVLDWQLDDSLTNKVAGHGASHFGLKTVDELEATKGQPFRLAALDISATEEVIAINVNRRWGDVVSGRATLLDISKGSWRLSKGRAGNCRYAIVHANGIVRGVFKLKGWTGPDAEGRYTFEAEGSGPMEGAEFSQKNASSLFGVAGSGSQNPIRYVRLPR